MVAHLSLPNPIIKVDIPTAPLPGQYGARSYKEISPLKITQCWFLGSLVEEF